MIHSVFLNYPSNPMSSLSKIACDDGYKILPQGLDAVRRC